MQGSAYLSEEGGAELLVLVQIYWKSHWRTGEVKGEFTSLTFLI